MRKDIVVPVLRRRVTLLLLCIVLTRGAWGQLRTGSISGNVTDELGAVVPGAKIEVFQLSTGETRGVSTDNSGDYRIPLLELGAYRVTAVKSGFKVSRHEGVILELDRETVVNHVLSVGDITESVVVTGKALIIEAAPSAMTNLVDSKAIEELPLNGRDYVQLATLQAQDS